MRMFIEPFRRAWLYRELVLVIVGRDLTARFKDSYFSWGWAVVAPIVMLFVYTSVFTTTLKIETKATAQGAGHYALSVFVGLILFNLFSELMYRAPTLIHEHAPLLRKSIFPSDTLAWIALLRSLVYAAIAFVVLLGFRVALGGSIPITVMLLPVVIVPFCLFLLGAIWFLAAIGAFTRDVSHFIITVIPALMFATPVFYTLADVPAEGRWLLIANPLTPFIEMSRDLVINGILPDGTMLAASTIFSIAVFITGNVVFMRYKQIIIDVV